MTQYYACVAAACLTVVTLSACLEHEDKEAATPTVYIAMQSHLESFLQWPTFAVGEPEATDGRLKAPAEPHFVHINRLPEPGSQTFPIGTIIIKTERPSPTMNDWHVYGMVKRGGSFNSAGAPGWEWLELLNDGANATEWRIDWRGEIPPTGVTYRCMTDVPERDIPDCNTCHTQAAHNDFVMSRALQLSNF